MSSILDPTTPELEFELDTGGFFIQGFQEQDNCINGSEVRDVIGGGDLTDAIDGGMGDDTIFGENGSDTLIGALGNDFLNGGMGDDVLKGNVGEDVLWGGEGNDILAGGIGQDVLTGGEGEDTFIFELLTEDGLLAQIDTVTDFTPSEDTIVINGVGEDDGVSYDPNTGIVSVDGQPIMQLDPGLDINESEDFELF